jgi:hypothetical protein
LLDFLDFLDFLEDENKKMVFEFRLFILFSKYIQ